MQTLAFSGISKCVSLNQLLSLSHPQNQGLVSMLGLVSALKGHVPFFDKELFLFSGMRSITDGQRFSNTEFYII